MDFPTAYQMMLEGKKVRLPNWPVTWALYLVHRSSTRPITYLRREGYGTDISTEIRAVYNPKSHEIKRNDWEEESIHTNGLTKSK